MAIHDVDKTGEDRDAPSPNSHDSLGDMPRMAHGTNSVNYVTDNTDSATNDRILFGNARLVLTDTIEVINDGSPLTTASKPHGLGFVPNVLAALEDAAVTTAGSGTILGVSINLPTFFAASVGGVTSGAVTFGNWLYAFADDTNVYVNMLNTSGAITCTVTYYLYQQVAHS